MLRIGLTGGIGSGKSTVASMLEQRGAAVIDTDGIARMLTSSGGAAMASIRSTFGDAYVTADGALDRVQMRQLAFNDSHAKRRLEAILHPLIGVETMRQAAAAQNTAIAAIVFDVPLLVESGHWRARVDAVLVVDCLEETQIDRVVSRSAWSRAAVRSVLAQQASRNQRRACADAVLFNDGICREQLAIALESIWRRWTDATRMKHVL